MYLLDTNAVIDFCNNKLPINAANFMEGIEPRISVITAIELFASTTITNTEKQILQEFTSIATVYNNINVAIQTQTIALRKAHKIKLPDAIIEATAIVYNLAIITRNVNDFKNIIGIKCFNPWDL
jgi:predicted nucleic acid-binding protein